MSGLPIAKILWAGNRPSDHDDHLHVEATPTFTVTPPLTRPPITPALGVIYDALAVEFGTPYYFHDPKPPAPNWSHMGWYNRRYIAGTNTWSQHAYSNALDIGPYYGKASQQKYYDFLTNYDETERDIMFTKGYNEADWKKLFDAGLVAAQSWETFKAYWVTNASKRTDEEHLQASGNIVIALATRGLFYRR